ncbi:MAG: phosphoadenylyl-sulfate reductase [Rhodospirillaceae bacterium]|nr:phosphoadenylyl-sulfate reductase [Rhodospirillaceae bacterium]
MATGLEQLAAALNTRHAGAQAESVLANAIQCDFAGQIALMSSFGAESAVLLHMVAAIDKATPIIFLDTGKLFGETRRYRDQLVALLGLTGARTITPDAQELAAADPSGVLWSKSTDACCDVRKVKPLDRALLPFKAWITGRKAYQGGERAALPLFEADERRIKLNPLSGWSRAQLGAYFERHNLPRHPLEADGYLSIGCLPCTSRVEAGEDARAGRWRGNAKTECGIHLARRSAS